MTVSILPGCIPLGSRFLEKLAKLPLIYGSPTVTAGNPPGLNTGASALVLMSKAEAERRDRRPLATLMGWSMASGHPDRIASIPAGAARLALEKTGLTIDQIDLIAQAQNSGKEDIENLRKDMQVLLGNDFSVIYPAAQGQRMTDMLSNYQIGLNFLSGMALFVGAFLIYNAFSITVVERTREFGMLRTVGMTRTQIIAQVVVEALVLGVVGSTIGLGLGSVLRAEALQKSGQREQAHQMLQEAAQKEPGNARVHEVAGRILLAEQQAEALPPEIRDRPLQAREYQAAVRM